MDNITIIGCFVIGAAAVTGLFFTVGKPVIQLNTTLVTLTSAVDNLSDKYRELKEETEKDINKLASHNSDAHGRIWLRVEEHETRITKLEK